jgi:hypothetical protein
MFPKFMTLSHRNRYGMVIAAQFVIASPDQVRGFSTRNPVVAQHWIPDQSLPRARSGVRDDSCEVRKLISQCAP